MVWSVVGSKGGDSSGVSLGAEKLGSAAGSGSGVVAQMVQKLEVKRDLFDNQQKVELVILTHPNIGQTLHQATICSGYNKECNVFKMSTTNQ
ncbi:hypothetical protein Dimus_031313 [Dionaea muscipula]